MKAQYYTILACLPFLFAACGEEKPGDEAEEAGEAIEEAAEETGDAVEEAAEEAAEEADYE